MVNNENLSTEDNSLEQATTEAVNVERYLENLSDVYNDEHAYESTTEMLNDDIDRNDNPKKKDNDPDPGTLEPTEPQMTTPEITSSTILSTTTSKTTTKPTTTSQESTTTSIISSSPSEPSTTTSQLSTTLQSSSTTSISTDSPSIPSPNPCLITDSEQCEITCSNTNSTELTNALIHLINGVDLMVSTYLLKSLVSKGFMNIIVVNSLVIMQ